LQRTAFERRRFALEGRNLSDKRVLSDAFDLGSNLFAVGATYASRAGIGLSRISATWEEQAVEAQLALAYSPSVARADWSTDRRLGYLLRCTNLFRVIIDKYLLRWSHFFAAVRLSFGDPSIRRAGCCGLTEN
jgi:hypothetical protein